MEIIRLDSLFRCLKLVREKFKKTFISITKETMECRALIPHIYFNHILLLALNLTKLNHLLESARLFRRFAMLVWHLDFGKDVHVPMLKLMVPF